MDPISLALAAVTGITSLFSGQKKTENSSSNESSSSKSTARTLNPGTESDLVAGIHSLFGGGIAQGQKALGSQLDKITGQPIAFNKDAFVKGITDAGTAKLDSSLEASLNDLFTGIGAGAGGNSMAAILANKLTRANEVDKAGIKASAEGSGAQIASGIRNDETSGIESLTAGFGKMLESMLTGVKGATVTEDTSGTKKANSTGDAKASGFDGNNLATIFSNFIPKGPIAY